LVPAIEDFGKPKTPQIRLQLNLPDRPIDEISRVWFMKEDGTQLVQLQQDRLVHNWRKTGTEDVYPRYEAIRSSYRSEIELLESFLAEEGLGVIAPKQCEVVYVNHIEASQDWNIHSELDRVLTTWKSEYSDNFLLSPEDVTFNARYRIHDDSSPIGRLHIQAQPALRNVDQRPLIVLTLTARGMLPADETGHERIFRFFDLGRDQIVRGFTSITTPEMHQFWKRKV